MSFAAALSRLAELARGGLLDGVSERVYYGGAEYMLRAGPAGAVPGASRLVRVRFAESGDGGDGRAAAAAAGIAGAGHPGRVLAMASAAVP